MFRFLAIAAAAALPASANAASFITPANFLNPLVEDFESVPVGAASVGSALPALGITSVSATASTNDPFDNAPARNASRALGVTPSGIEVVDPLNQKNVLATSMTFQFASDITRFGFGIHDSQGGGTLTFKNDGAIVDTLNFAAQAGGVLDFFYVTAAAFDEITVANSNAFALDHLTVEGLSSVPVPAAAPLMLAGLAAFGARRRRKANFA